MADFTGELAIMDPSGHTSVGWAVTDTETVQAARTKFQELLADGYTAFRMTDEESKTGELIREFDATAERVILVPRMVGG